MFFWDSWNLCPCAYEDRTPNNLTLLVELLHFISLIAKATSDIYHVFINVLEVSELYSLLHWWMCGSPIILTSYGSRLGLYISLGKVLLRILSYWLFFLLNYFRLMLESVCQALWKAPLGFRLELQWIYKLIWKRTDICILLNLSKHEHVIFLHFFQVFSYCPSITFYNFLHKGLSHLVLDLFSSNWYIFLAFFEEKLSFLVTFSSNWLLQKSRNTVGFLLSNLLLLIAYCYSGFSINYHAIYQKLFPFLFLSLFFHFLFVPAFLPLFLHFFVYSFLPPCSFLPFPLSLIWFFLLYVVNLHSLLLHQ